MRVLYHPLRAGGAAILGIAIGLTGALVTAQTSAPASAAVVPGLKVVAEAMQLSGGKANGTYTSREMSVEIALAPGDEEGLTRELDAVYTEGSGDYHKWLAKGQFAASYAPAASTRSAVENYLRGQGLVVSSGESPFLIRATGPSAAVAAAFHTSLTSYTGPRDVHYFANSKPVYFPASISGAIQAVIGLSNTVRPHSMAVRPGGTAAKASQASGASSCETGYVTTEELFARANTGTEFPYGYGGGPDCSGLTPSQTNSIYGAPKPSPRTQGAGVRAAVFELSAYQPSDLQTWARYFYGPRYQPDLSQVNVDGGPLSTASCPAGDTCEADYSGDIEVDADVEQEMAVSPDAHIYVYDAPFDATGQTSLDEYSAIANQDIVDTVSSSWGECEADDGEAYAQAQNTIFEQMALQGQSMFAAAGDDGAYDCLGVGGPADVAVDDPGSEPWVTSVGGTSLESDNPGGNPVPGAPVRGLETVWNPDKLCSGQPAAPDNDEQGGAFWCSLNGVGSGAGGSSEFWGQPFYQHGHGVISPYTTYGSSSCALASGPAEPCREVPDVSANADEFTPYAEYCTGNASTVNSTCAQIGDGGGWFQIGGTSLSSPLWAALTSDRDGYRGQRTGNINPLVYAWLDTDPGKYFNDITGIGKLQQAATNNGLFPTTPGYDEATGIGTPKFTPIITGLSVSKSRSGRAG